MGSPKPSLRGNLMAFDKSLPELYICVIGMRSSAMKSGVSCNGRRKELGFPLYLPSSGSP